MISRAKQISKYKEQELENGVFDIKRSFHGDFEGIPWVIVRGLSYELSEGDIMTIFEQYGTIVNMELVRDEKTGLSMGTALICYEDWRSSILAIDNFNDTILLDRTISVDHVKYEIGPKSKVVDPRVFVPARLLKTVSKPVPYDAGSASSTESMSEDEP